MFDNDRAPERLWLGAPETVYYSRGLDREYFIGLLDVLPIGPQLIWTETSWEEHKSRMAVWLAQMVAEPGWQDYARDKAKRLEKNELYAGIVTMAKAAKNEICTT